MMRLVRTIIGIVMAGGMTAVPDFHAAEAYESVEVAGGARIEGRVTLKGAAPEPRVFPAVLYPFNSYCQKNEHISDGKGNILLQDVSMGVGGGLRDVVISVEGVEAGKPFGPIAPEIRSSGCEFLPFVSVVRDGGEFAIRNEDPVLHNSQVYQAEKGNVILNVPIPPDSEKTHIIQFEPNRRIFQMICGMHEFMQTWGFAVSNPYYAVTGPEGRFAIDQLPAGEYELIVWHPKFQPIKKKFKVSAGKKLVLDFEFNASEVERSHYETQERFRIQ